MRILPLCVGLLAVASSAITALADESGYHQGALCNPLTPADSNSIRYSSFGVHNTSSVGSARVNCGGATEDAGDVTSVQVEVYDRDPSTDVSCYMRVQDADGSQVYVEQATSYQTGGQTLFFYPPANTHGMVHLDCTIPRAVGGNYSHVTSYHVYTSHPFTGNRRHNATLCHGAPPYDTSAYSPFGVHNTSSVNSSRVYCAAVASPSYPIGRVEVVVYDRHSSEDISCSVQVQRAEGYVAYTKTQKSNGSGSGPQTLEFIPPPETYGNVHFNCIIPPAVAGSYSHVTSYRIVNPQS